MQNNFFKIFKIVSNWLLRLDLRKESELWTKRLVFIMILLIGFSWFGNVSAQANSSSSEGCLDSTLKIGEYVNTSFPGVGNNPNSFSAVGNLAGGALATASTLVLGVCPEMAQQNSQFYEKLPNEMKNGGLTSLAFNETFSLYEKLPGVDIPQHFAKHWLPKDLYNNTVYAQAGPGDITSYALLITQGLNIIWTVVFNISMTAFIIVIMIAGFMVMFRAKLQQGTVSVGNAISRVILGVVLALSSFAIGALMIDLSKWLTRVVRELIFVQGIYAPGGKFSSGKVVDIEGPFSLAVSTFGNLANAGTIFDSLGIGTTTTTNLMGWAAETLENLAGKAGSFVTGGFGAAGSSILATFIATILGVMIITTSVKIYIKLLSLYIKLVISTVFGPLYALLGSIPGHESTITEWFKAMAADAVSIAMIYFFVNLAAYFMTARIMFYSFTGSTAISSTAAATGLDGLAFGAIPLSTLMGYVIFSMAASADDFIKERFQVKESAALRKGAEESTTGITTQGKGLLGRFGIQ